MIIISICIYFFILIEMRFGGRDAQSSNLRSEYYINYFNSEYFLMLSTHSVHFFSLSQRYTIILNLLISYDQNSDNFFCD